jgi:hypothetical protein
MKMDPKTKLVESFKDSLVRTSETELSQKI